MALAVSELTILFEDPFWVGLYERDDGQYTVCKITFGAEPKDQEVYDFLLKSWATLQFSPALPSSMRPEKHIAPKRMQRLIRRETAARGIGTKAQQALKLQQEAGKQARHERSRQEREMEQDRQFALRQQKRREKHRGH